MLTALVRDRCRTNICIATHLKLAKLAWIIHTRPAVLFVVNNGELVQLKCCSQSQCDINRLPCRFRWPNDKAVVWF